MVPTSILERSGSHSMTPSPVNRAKSLGESMFPVDDSKSPYLTTAARCRTAVACDKCRERKTKCSGEKPVCGRCSSRGLICIYASRELTTKRRPHTQTPDLISRHAFRENGSRDMAPAITNNTISSGQFYPLPPSPSVSKQFSASSYPPASSADDLRRRVCHAYPTACSPSVGSFIGGADHDNIVSSLAPMQQPTSYYKYVDAAPENEYPVAKSDSSESGGESLLGSTPHTPPDSSVLMLSGNPASKPHHFPSDGSDMSYFSSLHTDPPVNYHSQPLEPQYNPYFDMGSHDTPPNLLPIASSSLSSHEGQYDLFELALPATAPPHVMPYHDLSGYPVSNGAMDGAQFLSSSWPKSAKLCSTSSPERNVTYDQRSLQAGSLLMEPIPAPYAYPSS
ncbi:hypothetical protein L218DRAFT_1078649 [Marasmius fiardii PR-910]|nr:hypothetical protein L218DRAFT_1078649 [Marasmius fiardii PR-910]